MVLMDNILNLCKSRGFIFAGSEIYGGLANTWDYGPLGSILKNNIKEIFIKKFVKESEYNLLFDSSILMNNDVWKASGHVGNFSDPLMDCKDCKTRHRADKLIESQISGAVADGMDFEKMAQFIKDNDVTCPNCGSSNFTNIRKFNLMFKTFQGVTEDAKNEVYLRPETAQGVFVNFPNILRTSRKKIPFGVVNIGKSFRNEITPGNFIFRTCEFEQMELEFFCEEKESEKWFSFWKDFCRSFLLNLGMKKENIRFRDHSSNELSHYSSAATDIEFLFPFGWGELWGIANRGTYDLTTHQKSSGKSLEVFDQESNQKYLPSVIEPSLGLDRLLLSFLCNAYFEEEVSSEKRVVLKLHPALAPYKAAVLPISKKLSEEARSIYKELLKDFYIDYDEAGSIGKRYRRQDEIGTLFCITYDFQSKEDNQITIRNRDTMKQERIAINKISSFLKSESQLYSFNLAAQPF